MNFTTITFPAEGGPLDGADIEAMGMDLGECGIRWPLGVTTPEGYAYELKFDENHQPTHWKYVGQVPPERLEELYER